MLELHGKYVANAASAPFFNREGTLVEDEPSTPKVQIHGHDHPALYIKALPFFPEEGCTSNVIHHGDRNYLPVHLKGGAHVLLDIIDFEQRFQWKPGKISKKTLTQENFDLILQRRQNFSVVPATYSKIMTARQEVNAEQSLGDLCTTVNAQKDPVLAPEKLIRILRKALKELLSSKQESQHLCVDRAHYLVNLPKNGEDPIQVVLWSGCRAFLHRNKEKVLGMGTFSEVQRVFNLLTWRLEALKIAHGQDYYMARASHKNITPLSLEWTSYISASIQRATRHLTQEADLLTELFESDPSFATHLISPPSCLFKIPGYSPLHNFTASLMPLYTHDLKQLYTNRTLTNLQEFSRLNLLKLALKYLQGIQLLHKHHVIHGDLKEENTLCTSNKNGELVLHHTDLGGSLKWSETDFTNENWVKKASPGTVYTIGALSQSDISALSNTAKKAFSKEDKQLVSSEEASPEKEYQEIQQKRDTLSASLVLHTLLGFNADWISKTPEGFLELLPLKRKKENELYGEEIYNMFSGLLELDYTKRLSLSEAIFTLKHVIATAEEDAEVGRLLALKRP